MANLLSRLLSFAARNERPLGAALFTFGFLTDLFTFGLLPVSVVNWFFVAYLGLAGAATFGTHLVSAYRERDEWWRKTLSVVLPLAAQYALGGVLSGFVVFYAKSSVISVSWPFLLLLLLVYGGNEYFRKHKDKLVFQSLLFFFALYAYAIFALPLALGHIGPWVFLGSTAAAAGAFGLFLYLLKLVNAKRYRESRPPVLAGAVGILLLVNGAYFAGLIPPIPLVLTHAEVYHQLSREAGSYAARTDAPKQWWNPFPRTIPHVPGTPLYGFSAVKAPAAFTASITHEWERHIDGAGWQRQSRVSFPITGGRAEGYRGYSLVNDPAPGRWRLTISAGNQVVGRVYFSIEDAPSVELSHEASL